MSKTYTCEKCAKVFKQKGHFTEHQNKKNDCTNPQLERIIEEKVEEKVKEVVRKIVKPKEVTLDNLDSFFEDFHNLLWNKVGLNPEKAMQHMNLFFAFRMLELQADTLTLPNECRWSYIAGLTSSSILDSAIKKGITEFRKNTITKPFFFPHDIKKEQVVDDIVQLMNRISLDTLQQTDTLGRIFEHMLGRGMSTMADDGQYFTDRLICRLAFKLAFGIKQTLRRSDGSLCTFADWFCGTGGFMTEYIKGVKQNLSDIDWAKDKTAIYAQDQNESSVTTSLLNALIATGEPFLPSTIRMGNSFSDPITRGNGAPYPNMTVDYCFMNPPYGGDKTKGKAYKFAYAKGKGNDKTYLVNEDIRTIGIEDDDKVSAGVQLAMATLSDGGVCCIVLPQGFFFGASKKCVELRKKIAEEYRIHYVVDIESGSFLNTGTKTSMMVFQKGAGPTDMVTFMRLDETVLVEATLDELRAKNYSLNYKQYLPQSAVEIDGFEMVKLGDIVSFKAEKSKKDKNVYAYIDIGSVDKGKLNLGELIPKNELPGRAQYSVNVGDILLGKVRPNLEHYLQITSQNYRDNLIVSNGFSIMRCDTSKVLPTYLYSILALSSTTAYLTERATGTTYPVIDDSIIGNIQIPIPSLEKQQEIVDSIDGFTQLAHAEEQSLKMLEKSVMFEVKWMGMGKERVKLRKVIKKVKSGKTNSTSASGTGEFPFYGCTAIVPTNTHNSFDFEGDEYLLFAKSGGNARTKVGENLGIGKFHYVTGKTAGNIAVFQYSVDTELATCQFIYYLLRTKLEEIQLLADYTTGNGNINIELMYDSIELKLPSLVEQKTLQSDFDEIRHKHAKIAEYRSKAQAAIQRLIPGAK